MEKMNDTPCTGCTAPDLNSRLSEYCFGQLNSKVRAKVEAHLLDCDSCWTEASRLSRAIDVLRTDRSLVTMLSRQDVLSITGASSRLHLPFGGHSGWALVLSCLYSLNYLVMLALELAYGFDAYSRLFLVLGPATFFWILTTTLYALHVAGRRVGQRYAAVAPTAIVFSASGALCLLLNFSLPSTPVTKLAHGVAMTPFAAYVKDVMYLLPIALVYLIIPWRFVTRLQFELKHGRHRNVRALLGGREEAVAPRGTVYLTTATLRLIVLLVLGLSIYMTVTLLAALDHAPYHPLFVVLMYVRLGVYFGFIGCALLWYSGAINDLKRECIIQLGR